MIIAANWKMNMGYAQAQNFLFRFKQLVKTEQKARHFVFFPPALLAGLFQGGDWLWGGQNVHSKAKGAWTGENAAQTLKEMGASFCLVGHSERRLEFGDSEQAVAKKFQLLRKTGLVPLLCVGETLKHRSRKREILKQQLGFLKPAKDEPKALLVAYEPVWAIGSGKTPSFQEIEESLQCIKEHLSLPGLKTLYGGSVDKALAKGLAQACSAVDGFLIGGASLDPHSLYDIYLSSQA